MRISKPETWSGDPTLHYMRCVTFIKILITSHQRSPDGLRKSLFRAAMSIASHGQSVVIIISLTSAAWASRSRSRALALSGCSRWSALWLHMREESVWRMQLFRNYSHFWLVQTEGRHKLLAANHESNSVHKLFFHVRSLFLQSGHSEELALWSEKWITILWRPLYAVCNFIIQYRAIFVKSHTEVHIYSA